MAITINVDSEFIDKLAEAIAQRSAVKTLADAGMTRDSARTAPSESQSDPWDDTWPSTSGVELPAVPAVSAPRRAETIIVNSPKGRQRWTLYADNAPECGCGEPAAYVEGATNGKSWKRWACSKGSGDEWRNKCDFSEWIR